MNAHESRTRLVQGIALAILFGCGGGGSDGGGGNPGTPADVAGTWQIVESISGNCPSQQTSDQYQVTVTQSGNTITVASSSGTFQGTVSGNIVSWTGSYPNNGGTVTITGMSLTVNGNSLSGTANWVWTDGSISCSGSTQVTGTRTSGGGGTGGSAAGTWEIVENIMVSSGPCQSFTTTYPIQIAQSGSSITVSAGGYSFSGTLQGSQLQWSGSYPEEGGTTTMTVTATIQADSLSGGSTWSWTDGSESCTGTSTFTGTRTGSAIDLSMLGAWRFTEEVLRVIGSESRAVGEVLERQFEIARSPSGAPIVRGLGSGEVPARFDAGEGQLMFHVTRSLPNGESIDEEFSIVFDGAGALPTAFGLCEWTVTRNGELLAEGTSSVDGEQIASATGTGHALR